MKKITVTFEMLTYYPQLFPVGTKEGDEVDLTDAMVETLILRDRSLK